MALQTKSTGTKSHLYFGSIDKFLNIPYPLIMIKKPPAANESVQPGKGSLYDAYMIAGLNMHIGILPLCFFKDLSERLFVKVYVLTQGAIISFSLTTS